MTILAELLGRLQERARRGMELGLEPTHRALAALGDPHAALAVVHVAGSNGKGSTSAMVESIARAAGLRTGLYTSPHLCRFAERIRIDGASIGDDAFARSLERTLGADEALTFFESLTVAAFDAFHAAGVDLAILEVGLGGRLDATNVVERPLVTAITSIALEHTEFLGSTLDAIAREKAGIVKPGVPLVVGPLPEEASLAIAEIATKAAAPMLRPTAEHRGDRIEIRGAAGRSVETSLGLAGPHQADNAAIAAQIAWTLAERWPALEGAVAPGLAAAAWPGRLERIAIDGRTVILDCAHNLEGIAALARALERFTLAPESTHLVFGALADKPFASMLARLAPLAHRRVYATPKGRAPAPLEALASVAAGELAGDPRLAIARAVAGSRPGDTIVVTGSIYLVGEVRGALLGIACDPVIAL